MKYSYGFESFSHDLHGRPGGGQDLEGIRFRGYQFLDASQGFLLLQVRHQVYQFLIHIKPPEIMLKNGKTLSSNSKSEFEHLEFVSNFVLRISVLGFRFYFPLYNFQAPFSITTGT